MPKSSSKLNIKNVKTAKGEQYQFVFTQGNMVTVKNKEGYRSQFHKTKLYWKGKSLDHWLGLE